MDTNNLHIHQFHETIVPPTCQSSGYTVYSCDCGYAHKANFVPATAHSFQVTETVPATCTTPGSIRSVCSGCGAVSTQSTPVLNHDYGEWAVQVYPTCEAPGKRANQCRRCGTTVEETIAPLGHKCASGTARYANGRMIDFFCENCGQNIHTQLPSLPQQYVGIKTLFLMSAIIESLYLVIVIIRTMVDHVTYSNPLYIFGSPVVGITWGILFFIFANQIKANEKYTRWMGIEPILRQVMVILAFVENALWNLENGYAYSLSDMLPSTLLIKGPAFLIGLFFAVIFFTGMQKKTWPFVVRLILFGIAQISNLIVAGYQIVNYIAHDYELFYNAQTIISSIYSTLYGIAFLMLMAPNKKSSNTPKTP